MFFCLLFSSNSAVIDWLRVPDTQFMLDQVRPDFLMLRVCLFPTKQVIKKMAINLIILIEIYFILLMNIFECFQTISRGLVSWDFVVPSFEWIKSMIPQVTSTTS